MKRIIIIALLLASPQAFAGGEYDGIWTIGGIKYITVNQSAQRIVIASLDAAGGFYTAHMGNVNGKVATISTVLGVGLGTSRITFITPDYAELVILSCTPTPGFVCGIPNGIPVVMTRVHF